MTQNYLDIIINRLRQIKVVMETVKPHNSLAGGRFHEAIHRICALKRIEGKQLGIKY